MKRVLLRYLVTTFALCAVATLSSAQQDESHGVKSSDGKLISVHHPNEDIRVVLRNVADVCELNLVIPETLVGRTSVRLRNVTWRQVFDVVLSEQNYTYVEEGNIVRVVSRDLLSGNGQSESVEAPEPDSPFEALLWWRTVLIVAAVVITAVCNVCLFIGVLIDTPPGQTRFVPKLVWALLMLVGGVTAAAGYWLIHHSKLRPSGQGIEKVNAQRDPS